MRLSPKAEYIDGFYIKIAPNEQVIFSPSEAKKNGMPIQDENPIDLKGRPQYFEINPEPSSRYATFCHEYWHYLLNISTLARLRDLYFLLSQVAIFTNTVNDPRRAICCGIPEDLVSEFDKFFIMRKQFLAFQGQVKIMGVEVSQLHGLQIREATQAIGDNSEDDSKSPMDHEEVFVTLDCTTNLGRLDLDFRFGIIALEEGLTSSISRRIAPFEPVPPIPYSVPEHMARSLGLSRPTPSEIEKLITLALLTMDPPRAYITLVKEYVVLRKTTQTDRCFEIIWQNMKPQYVSQLEHFRLFLDELVSAYEKKGVCELAAKHIKTVSLENCEKRLIDPFYDLKPFGKSVDFEKLDNFMKELPSCNILQERHPSCEFPKDLLVNKDDRVVEGNSSPYAAGEYFAALACNFHFAKTHADENFKPSGEIQHSDKTRCPFFSSCDNDRRKNSPSLCVNSPWLQFNPNEASHCWYGQGALATRWKGALPTSP